MVFCTEFFGWLVVLRAAACHHPNRTHDPRSGSQDHHHPKNSVQKTICCNSTSNAPDDGRMRPKHVELRIHQQITLLDQVGISHYLKNKNKTVLFSTK